MRGDYKLDVWKNIMQSIQYLSLPGRMHVKFNLINQYNTISAHEHKSRLHTMFSVNEDYIGLKIGESAQAGAFDWTNPLLNDLRDLIATGFID